MNPAAEPSISARSCCVGATELLRDADGTLASLSEGGIHEADITDRASVETDRALWNCAPATAPAS